MANKSAILRKFVALFYIIVDILNFIKIYNYINILANFYIIYIFLFLFNKILFYLGLNFDIKF